MKLVPFYGKSGKFFVGHLDPLGVGVFIDSGAIHSDRGSQYCAHAYQEQLKQFGMKASMSRKGDCWDNAPMESFWGSLKNELVHHQRFVTREQARREITEYIEIFYNRIRKQARLGYLSPAAFNHQYYAKQIAA